MPPKVPSARIIADDLPGRSMSASAYDAPKRVNVIQIDLPVSTSKTVSHVIDPRTQLTPDLKQVKHGVNPTKFLQVNLRSSPVHNKAPLPHNHAKPAQHHVVAKEVSKMMGVDEALDAARQVELKAKKLTEGITVKLLYNYN